MKKSSAEEKVSPEVAAILRNRDIREEDFAKFLNPTYDEFQHDPFLFPDMKKAVSRIKLAKKLGQKITIYGDYDIDGMTATVILWESLRRFGLNVETYTPDRFTEGYGLNIDAVEQIAKSGAKLIITVDNGTLSFAEIARARELGVDVIVTDHHSPHETLPGAVAILNPKVIVAKSPEKYNEKFLLKKDSRATFLDEKAKKILAKYPKFDDGRIDYTNEKICYVVNCSVACGDEILLAKRGAKVIAYPNTWNGISGFFDKTEKSVEEIVAKELCEELNAPENYELKIGKMFVQKDEKIGCEWRVFPAVAEFREKFEPQTNWENKSAKWVKITSAKKLKLMPNYGETLRRALKLRENSRETLYPFCDLCGAGVAFKLVQALQIDSLKNAEKFAKNPRNYLIPLAQGQEKWLLDLVALGTVCDVVGLVDENRANVKWGLEVMKKTRRSGLRALVATAGANLAKVDARTLGFVIGPRLNAAGRLETAEMALELLKLYDSPDDISRQETTNSRSLELAEKLDQLNHERREIQDEIFAAAAMQIDETNPVAIAVGDGWHEGVIGIVAAKILEKFERPAFVLSCGVEFAKGSGRSFGEFSCAAVIHATDDIIEKGGGHLAAGGLTVRREKVEEWKIAVQKFYRDTIKNPAGQKEFLYPMADLTLTNFANLTPELIDEIAKLEPLGQGNAAPVFEFANVLILSRRTMGKNSEHVKYVFADNDGRKFTAVAFGAADKFTLEPYDTNGEPTRVNIRVELSRNEWNGVVSVEGKLIKLDPVFRE